MAIFLGAVCRSAPESGRRAPKSASSKGVSNRLASGKPVAPRLYIGLLCDASIVWLDRGDAACELEKEKMQNDCASEALMLA